MPAAIDAGPSGLMRALIPFLVFTAVLLPSLVCGQRPQPQEAEAALPSPEATTEPAASVVDSQARTPQPAAPVQAPAPAATPAPVAPPPRAVEASAPSTTQAHIEFATRLAILEQLVTSQRDRDVAIYRDTNQLITVFGISFAVIGMLGLVAAAFFNYRGMVAIQTVQTHRLSTDGTFASSAPGLPAGPVPGMERVQASGQRFQAKMSSLEARLAEIEHLTGGHPTPSTPTREIHTPAPVTDAAQAPVSIDEPAATPVRRIIPRAAILAHKAEALLNMGKLDDAMKVLSEAESIDGSLSNIHIVRGRVLEKSGRLGDALIAYERAVDCDSANTGALLMKAGVLNRQERFAEALACYEKALESQQSVAS